MLNVAHFLAESVHLSVAIPIMTMDEFCSESKALWAKYAKPAIIAAVWVIKTVEYCWKTSLTISHDSQRATGRAVFDLFHRWQPLYCWEDVQLHN